MHITVYIQEHIILLYIREKYKLPMGQKEKKRKRYIYIEKHNQPLSKMLFIYIYIRKIQLTSYSKNTISLYIEKYTLR